MVQVFGQSQQAISNALVVLYDERHQWQSQAYTNSTGYAVWPNMGSGSYYVEVYYYFDSGVMEYWGNQQVSLAYGKTVAVSFAKQTPSILSFYCVPASPAPNRSLSIQSTVYTPLSMSPSPTTAYFELEIFDNSTGGSLIADQIHGPVATSTTGYSNYTFAENFTKAGNYTLLGFPRISYNSRNFSTDFSQLNLKISSSKTLAKSSLSLISGYTTNLYPNLVNKNLNFLQEWASIKNTWSSGIAGVQAVSGYTSYAQFSRDMANGGDAILKAKGITWLSYDPEIWSATPINEQNDPVNYSTQFYNLAHQHDFKVIQEPGLPFVNKYGAASWAHISDIFDYQAEYIEQTQSSQSYANAVCNTAYSVHAANQTLPFYFELVVTPGSSTATNAFNATVNYCPLQPLGIYLAGGAEADQLAFLRSVGMAS